jgi:hypothetical protein
MNPGLFSGLLRDSIVSQEGRMKQGMAIKWRSLSYRRFGNLFAGEPPTTGKEKIRMESAL